MKRIITCILQITIIYVLPILWNIDLVLRPEILILVVISSLLILSQPNFDAKEAQDNKGTDKWSFWAIMITCTVGQILAVLEWALYSTTFEFNLLGPQILVGIGLMIVGLAVRINAIQSLGNNFSGTVQIKSDQMIITSGLYKFLRHPSYTGAWLIMLGSSIFLGSLIGLVILGLGMFITYIYRINVEEKALVASFGDIYTKYQKTTWRMIPLIW